MEASVGPVDAPRREDRGVSVALAASTLLAALPLVALLSLMLLQGPRFGEWRMIWAMTIVLGFVTAELILGNSIEPPRRTTFRRAFTAGYAGVCACWIATRLTVQTLPTHGNPTFAAGWPIAWLQYERFRRDDNFAPPEQLEALAYNAALWILAGAVLAFALRGRLWRVFVGSREVLAVWRCAALVLTTLGFAFLRSAFD